MHEQIKFRSKPYIIFIRNLPPGGHRSATPSFHVTKIGVFALQDLEDVLYTSHRFVPVKERMGWIRGSNLGYTTALQVD